jgi:hypothetical protein
MGTLMLARENKGSPYSQKQKQKERDMIKGVQKNILHIFHTLAHLDESVCLASPWIHCLTWQNTRCKYASILHPYPKLHISLFRSRMKKKKANSKAFGKDINTIERFESTI